MNCAHSRSAVFCSGPAYECPCSLRLSFRSSRSATVRAEVEGKPDPPRRPNKDVSIVFNRRLSNTEFSGIDKPDLSVPAENDPPTRPTKGFSESVRRRISRGPEERELLQPPMSSLLTDALGRKPKVKNPLDVPKNPAAPPILGMRPRNELKYDRSKEMYREYRRIVYDFDYWSNHRSTYRALFNILNIPASRILREIAAPVLMIILWAAAIAYDVPQQAFAASGITLPEWTQAFETKLADAPVTLTGSILFLLVVFRTNNAYTRFDEARKMWGLLLNRSRDIVRQAISFFPEDDMHRKATFARWTIAMSQTLKAHLRPGEDLSADLKGVLTDKELGLVLSADHKVLCCLQAMSDLIQDTPMQEAQRYQMQKELTVFEDILGGSERLLRTPIPVSYTRHATRMIMVWLFAFPVCLQEQVGTALIPATAFLAFLLLGMEEIGVENEDSFGILPLEVIANKAKADIIELMNKQHENRDFSMIRYKYTPEHSVFTSV